jgi:hypothetical protein
MTNSRHIFTKVVGIICVLLVALFCVLAVYDLCVPWSIASQSLERFGKRYRFCIGMSSESFTSVTPDKTTSTSSQQRAFIIIPAPISWPRFVAVSQDQAGRVTLDESAVVFWFWLVMSGGVLWGAWRWFLRSLF